MPIAGVKPVEPFGGMGSEKRARFWGLFGNGVDVMVGLAGEMASLVLLDRRKGTGSVGLLSAMFARSNDANYRNSKLQSC